MIDAQEFWWDHITGPHTVVDHVSSALLERKLVVLKVPVDMPWRDSMRGSVNSEFREKTGSNEVVIELVDVTDENPEGLEPGRFILKRFASSSISAGYRSRQSIQDYIVSNNVIKNRIVWIKGLKRENDVDKWIKFCRGFSPKSLFDGLFVIEIHGQKPKHVSDSKNMAYVDFDKYISNYDVQLFASFVLSDENKYSDNWKRYISTMVAVLCGIDAELAEMLLENVDFKVKSLADILPRIVDAGEFSRRGEESSHILWYVRNGDMAEVNHRIWAAQIQVLFPIIEMERVSFIEKWKEQISNVIQNNFLTQYGEPITDIMDIELGTLCFLMDNRLDAEQYMLYIPNEDDRDWIHFLHNCRNALAHVSCCDPETVSRLIKGIED